MLWHLFSVMFGFAGVFVALIFVIGLARWYVARQHHKNSYRAQVEAEKQRLRAMEQAKNELEAEKHSSR